MRYSVVMPGLGMDDYPIYESGTAKRGQIRWDQFGFWGGEIYIRVWSGRPGENVSFTMDIFYEVD